MSGVARREAQAFLSAVQFLTRLPTPAWTGWEDGRLDWAAPHFALVGGVVGLPCAAAVFAARGHWPSRPPSPRSSRIGQRG